MHFLSAKWYWYVADGNYFASEGVHYRILLNLLPAIIFLVFLKNFNSNHGEKRLYLVFSLITILVFPLASYGSTFIDRLLIYFYPLQIYVYSNYNYFISKRTYNFFITFIVVFYFIILYVYFNYGLYSSEWIPYKSALIR